MNLNKHAFSVFYIVTAITLIIFLLLLPYPYYSTDNGNWFLGTPTASRLLYGVTDKGIPLDKAFEKIIRAKVLLPFEASCTTNNECDTYEIINQCTAYCGNKNPENKKTQENLNNIRICDPALWNKPQVNCVCLMRTCIDSS